MHLSRNYKERDSATLYRKSSNMESIYLKCTVLFIVANLKCTVLFIVANLKCTVLFIVANLKCTVLFIVAKCMVYL